MPPTRFLIALLRTALMISVAFGPAAHAGAGSVTTPAVAGGAGLQSFKRQYLGVLDSYNKQLCSGTTRKTFQKLYRDYRAGGFYIPLSANKEIDQKIIQRYMKLIEDKNRWVRQQRKQIPGARGFPKYDDIARPVTKDISRLLDIKKRHRLEKDPKKKAVIVEESKAALRDLQNHFTAMTEKIPFLLSFRHPIDHFDNRFRYENFKREKDKEKENDIFFMRKVLEDGAFDKDHTRSDLYLRTTLDTVALNLSQQRDFLEENVRYDLEWVLIMIRENLRRGHKKQTERLKEWEKRSNEELAFYKGLATGKPKKSSGALVAQRSKATEALRDFVYRKHAEAYEFFSKQPELMQAAFALDQILLNEAGMATAENYRDRRDIAQVVINRRFHNHYSVIDPSESLHSYLLERKSLKASTIKASHWLNTLFKEEQFSFTLWFIPAVEYVFCPDFFRTARVSRDSNLALIHSILQKPNVPFRALRYFSRFSMVGKIDMSKMWSGYAALPESPGRQLQQTDTLKSHLKSGNYRYLYDFKDADGSEYHVLEINGSNYSVKGFPDRPQFFNHRDPHKFTYFEPLSSDSSKVSDGR